MCVCVCACACDNSGLVTTQSQRRLEKQHFAWSWLAYFCWTCSPAPNGITTRASEIFTSRIHLSANIGEPALLQRTHTVIFTPLNHLSPHALDLAWLSSGTPFTIVISQTPNSHPVQGSLVWDLPPYPRRTSAVFKQALGLSAWDLAGVLNTRVSKKICVCKMRLFQKVSCNCNHHHWPD